MQFYGREHETALLRRYQKISRTGPSQMVVVAGRRRVGKSRLIHEALNEPNGRAPFLYFFVNPDKTEKGNVDAFLRLYADALGVAGLSVTFPDLRSLVECILQRSKTQPMTLVIDEFPESQDRFSRLFRRSAGTMGSIRRSGPAPSRDGGIGHARHARDHAQPEGTAIRPAEHLHQTAAASNRRPSANPRGPFAWMRNGGRSPCALDADGRRCQIR